ncbi:hypothetical protein PA598K_07298, partial [Paenibacillus sp. 598K]
HVQPDRPVGLGAADGGGIQRIIVAP